MSVGEKKEKRKSPPFEKPQRVDWIRAKAPIADRVSFWLRTEALGEEGAFDGSYWM
jgi:hypothetical protein